MRLDGAQRLHADAGELPEAIADCHLQRLDQLVQRGDIELRIDLDRGCGHILGLVVFLDFGGARIHVRASGGGLLSNYRSLLVDHTGHGDRRLCGRGDRG